jgi:hypothetical protein
MGQSEGYIAYTSYKMENLTWSNVKQEVSS